jgi:hypothetical protein
MTALPTDCLGKFAELRHQSNAYRAILHHNTFFSMNLAKRICQNLLETMFSTLHELYLHTHQLKLSHFMQD